ncbi:ATP-binding protein [Streptomyces sp. NPDC048508]|uniref:ATP-binding protein n=1 Tax=Streptomyces sp. NPDC048508 TaxID=3365561 RepID=UPI00371385A8
MLHVLCGGGQCSRCRGTFEDRPGSFSGVGAQAPDGGLSPVPGLEVRFDDGGFCAQLTASAAAFSTVRALTVAVSQENGTGTDLAQSAELVVSELMSNVVEACPATAAVLLVVEVSVTPMGVDIAVHDSAPGQPARAGHSLDSDEATSGRGLRLLDLLCEEWTVAPSPLGKQVRCHLAAL